MACKCVKYNGEGRYDCFVSGSECMFMIPDSRACAEKFGEGPDATNDESWVDESQRIQKEKESDG